MTLTSTILVRLYISQIKGQSNSSTRTILNESPKPLKIGTKTGAASKATTEMDEAIATIRHWLGHNSLRVAS
ncbi:hypothetical protein BCON_0028g00090 [Botryotinia convoluta]|uniref:Uncharacterized protein n=1 Tax=Botryotinia convoluta TaxID=54673 RepID=A0A4Z1IL86_9HELO|nr:hypothetical protein BCON_0028g00090 [Botryotinia convoluta]